ncbi:MAG: SUMF1/EgtB/PvdO family nonheme iron enzyme [Elusimicrobiota bacterium]
MIKIKHIAIAIICLGLAPALPAHAGQSAGNGEAAVNKLVEALATAVDEKEATALRAQLFTAVKEMITPPAIPEAARKDMLKAQMKVESGDFKAAAEAYLQAVKLAPFAPKIYHHLALVYGAMKDYKAAKKWMGVYLEAAPEAPGARAAKDEIMKWEIQLEDVEVSAAEKKAEIEKKERGALARVPAGTFFMGSPDGVGGGDERPRHAVYLDAYRIYRYEVTVAQYNDFASATGRKTNLQESWSTGRHPVVNVDWRDADAYCKWAGGRLPTEAEWEKAARGGAETAYSFGDDKSKLGEYAWYEKNSDKQAHPVGMKKPNQYGIYDMYGNVMEWVADRYDSGYYKKSLENNPKGPDSGKNRVMRGGAWYSADLFLSNTPRPAIRFGRTPGLWDKYLGFRCVIPEAVGPLPASGLNPEAANAAR